VQDVDLGRVSGLARRAARRWDQLDDQDRPADRRDRVRGADLDDLAGPHPLAHDAHRDLAGREIDGGATGLLLDREGRELAHRDERLAAQQDADHRLLGGRDVVPDEHVVLELQGLGGGESGAGHRYRTGQRGDNPDAAAAVAAGLREGGSRPDGE